MPWLMQMMGCAVMIIGIALAVWIGFWLLLVLACLSLGLMLWRYLVQKGIVNPTPGIRPEAESVEESTEITVIEGTFERVEQDDKAPKE